MRFKWSQNSPVVRLQDKSRHVESVESALLKFNNSMYKQIFAILAY
jgi:hypothetical protein